MRFLADGLRGPTRDGMDFTARNLQKPAKKLTNSAFSKDTAVPVGTYKIPTCFFPKRNRFGIIFAPGFYFLFLNAMHFVSMKWYRFIKIGENNFETVAFLNFLGGSH